MAASKKAKHNGEENIIIKQKAKKKAKEKERK